MKSLQTPESLSSSQGSKLSIPVQFLSADPSEETITQIANSP